MELSSDLSALLWFIAGLAGLLGGAVLLLPGREEAHRSVQPSRCETVVPKAGQVPVRTGRRLHFRRKQPGIRDTRSDEGDASYVTADPQQVTKLNRKGESRDVYMVSFDFRSSRSASFGSSCAHA